MSASPLDERRQRAREAFWDAVVDVGAREAAEAAIETATRVRITREIREACVQATGYGYDIPPSAYDDIIRTAFSAAGFEVEG